MSTDRRSGGFHNTFRFSNSKVLGHQQFQAPLENVLTLFFPNDIVFTYFDYPVIFPNLLAALNLVLAVET